jgi:hypothetical protein
MDVSRWAIDLKLAPADRHRLEDLVRNGNTPQKLVPRARIDTVFRVKPKNHAFDLRKD